MCFGQKSKSTTTTYQTKESLPEPGIEPGTPSAQVECIDWYRLLSSYLTVLKQWVEM